MRRSGLAFLVLFFAFPVILSCASDDTANEVVEQPTSDVVVEPTFTRVTVTPVPIDTPTPTPTPPQVTESAFTPEQLADPVFPDWLDPELNDERPTDEELFAGWQEFLTNTRVSFPDGGHVNFCADGVIVSDEGEIDTSTRWKVTRTAAMSSREWGKVVFVAQVLEGEFAGREWTVMEAAREDGKIMQLGWFEPAEMKVERSRTCLELTPPGSVSDLSSAAVEDSNSIREFPASINPDLVSERPSDEEIYAGWTEFLSDAVVYDEDWLVAGFHFCSDGSFWYPIAADGTLEMADGEWEVRHSPALASSDWATVNVIFSQTFSRVDGETMRHRGEDWSRVEVRSSDKCSE